MVVTEFVMHVDHDNDGAIVGVGVIARVDQTIGEFPIVRLYIGDAMVFTMSPALAEAITDALLDAASTAADPPVVAYG